MKIAFTPVLARQGDIEIRGVTVGEHNARLYCRVVNGALVYSVGVTNTIATFNAIVSGLSTKSDKQLARMLP